ncbi:MAG: hypothetical protein RIR34_149 [Actinomycetota bacterium]
MLPEIDGVPGTASKPGPALGTWPNIESFNLALTREPTFWGSTANAFWDESLTKHELPRHVIPHGDSAASQGMASGMAGDGSESKGARASAAEFYGLFGVSSLNCSVKLQDAFECVHLADSPLGPIKAQTNVWEASPTPIC